MFSVAVTARTHIAAPATTSIDRRGGSNARRSPRPLRSGFHHPGMAKNTKRSGSGRHAVRVLAAAPSPTSEDACTPEDVGCTWETLEREVSEELVMNVMSKSVTVCHPDASVLDALEILVKNRISARRGARGAGRTLILGVPVVDDDDKVLGVISEVDLLVRLGHHRQDDGMFPKIGRCDEFGGSVKDLWSRFFDLQDRMERAQGTLVRDAMHEVQTIAPDMRLVDAADLILDGKLNRLVVVDGDERLVGVLSRGDVIRRTFETFDRGRRGGAAGATGSSGNTDSSDPAISREALNGAGGLDEFCDEAPDADECRVFD